MNLSGISTHWVALHEALGLGAPIADEAHCEQTLAIVEQLFDAVAADPAHPAHPWPPLLPG
jgi:HTH-type transcriptional regulator/antitoxin HigA